MILRPRIAIPLILLAVVILYSRVSRAYFCGFDDFYEVHRAAFEDRLHPARIFTTSHFDTPKYRPLNRAVIFVTYWIGSGRPLFFRLRNLGFHLASVALVYGLGWLLFQSGAIAFTAALLFGLHPLVNQNVVLSTCTNTLSHSLLLFSLFSFVYSFQDRTRGMRWLGLSLSSVWISVFFYEAGIVVFGLFYAYLFFAWLFGRKPIVDRRLLAALILVTAAASLSLMSARRLFVPAPASVSSAGAAIRNAALYLGALLLPVDPLLAHDWLGTPEPAQIHSVLSGPRMILIALAAGALLLAVLVIWWKRRRARPAKLAWPVILWLIAGIAFSLAPFLLYTEHASETYLYLPIAFSSLLFAAVLRWLFEGPWAYSAIVGLLALSFATGTWFRNDRVAACGSIANRILTGLPVDHWRQGSWHIRLATVPGEPVAVRYGIYGYNGLSTIDAIGSGLPAAARALQLATRNESITAELVPPEQMHAPCPRPDTCFWIHADGQVSPAP